MGRLQTEILDRYVNLEKERAVLAEKNKLMNARVQSAEHQITTLKGEMKAMKHSDPIAFAEFIAELNLTYKGFGATQYFFMNDPSHNKFNITAKDISKKDEVTVQELFAAYVRLT
jgi:hypothetical protein